MKTSKGNNIIALFMALLMLSSVCLPTVSAKENTDPSLNNNKIDVVIEDRPDIQVIEMTKTSNIVQVGNVLISLNSNENFTEGIMEIEDVKTSEKDILKFEVTELSNEFKVDVICNDKKSESYFTKYNPLNPDDTKEMLSQKETSDFIQSEQVTTASTRSTSYIWDDVYFVKGSGVKYPHPSYSIYTGEVWENYYINGDDLKHHHIKQSTSNTISQLAPAAAGASIGAYLGSVPGAAIGAVLGLMLGGTSSDALLDEEGCIWYWDAYTMDYITIVIYSSTSIFVPKYYRISSYTLWDTINVGNP
jgi:hypothetical protein